MGTVHFYSGSNGLSALGDDFTYKGPHWSELEHKRHVSIFKCCEIKSSLETQFVLSRLRENLTPRSVSGNILHVFIVTKLVLQGFANYRMLSLVPAEPQSFRFCFFLLVLLSKLLAVQTTEWNNNNFYCLHSSVEYKCPSVRSETFACGMCEQNVLVRRVPVLPYMWPAVNKQVVQSVQSVQTVQAVQTVHNKTISPNQRYHFQCKLEHSPFSYIWLLERSFLLMCSRI